MLLEAIGPTWPVPEEQSMRDRKRLYDSSVLKWTVFLFLLAMVMAWAVRGVLDRAWRMQTASTSASVFARMTPGTQAKAIIRLDQVAGEKLKGTLLERESDTAYRVPIGSGPAVAAVLTPETSVVMGRSQDIAAGAIDSTRGHARQRSCPPREADRNPHRLRLPARKCAVTGPWAVICKLR